VLFGVVQVVVALHGMLCIAVVLCGAIWAVSAQSVCVIRALVLLVCAGGLLVFSICAVGVFGPVVCVVRGRVLSVGVGAVLALYGSTWGVLVWLGCVWCVVASYICAGGRLVVFVGAVWP
jgi:hypothetical protein